MQLPGYLPKGPVDPWWVCGDSLGAGAVACRHGESREREGRGGASDGPRETKHLALYGKDLDLVACGRQRREAICGRVRVGPVDPILGPLDSEGHGGRGARGGGDAELEDEVLARWRWDGR